MDLEQKIILVACLDLGNPVPLTLVNCQRRSAGEEESRKFRSDVRALIFVPYSPFV